ncbi:hypothetical protein ACSBR2_039148 [Camellia fascicularis]
MNMDPITCLGNNSQGPKIYYVDKLGQGGYGTVYKGQLSNDVHIVAKILNAFKGNGGDLINEVGTIDHKFNPKISDFGLAKLCSKEQSVVSTTATRGMVGYIAPKVFSRIFGNVSYKLDVYSFGMLLLETVGGRENTNVTEHNTGEVYFPECIYNCLNQGEEQEIVIEEDRDAKIVKKLTIVGLWCIQWYPRDQPAMKVVVQMLEGNGETLAMPPSPFTTTNPKTSRGGWTFDSKLEVISEFK